MSEVYKADDGVLRVAGTGEVVTCSLFALCDRPAEYLMEMPALGVEVPACERCCRVLDPKLSTNGGVRK